MQAHILGTSLSLESDEGPEHLSCVLRHVNQMIEEVKQLQQVNDPLKIAVLVSCMLSSEYWKLRNKYITMQKQTKGQQEHIQQYTEHLLNHLESNLPPQMP